MRDAAQRWTACNFPDLLFESWEGDYLLFNPASGETHLLNQAGFVLLQELARQPASLTELAQHHLEEQAHADLLAQHIGQLELIGLICKAAPEA